MLPAGRPVTSWVLYTTSCNTQPSAPEDGRNYRPKHVELIGIINKPLLLHLVGCLYYLYQWYTVNQKSNLRITSVLSVKKKKFRYNRTRITGTLNADLLTFFVISRPFLLRMRNVSEKSCRENQNTHFVFSNVFFFETRAICEIVWKNIVDLGRAQMIYGACALYAWWLRPQTQTQNT